MNALGIINPAFAHLVPSSAPTLRDFWIAAVDAADALSKADGELSLEIAANDTRQALIDHLLFEHGLTVADMKKSVL